MAVSQLTWSVAGSVVNLMQLVKNGQNTISVMPVPKNSFAAYVAFGIQIILILMASSISLKITRYVHSHCQTSRLRFSKVAAHVQHGIRQQAYPIGTSPTAARPKS